MKLAIHRESFLKAFSRAAIAAPARSHNEIFTNVLLNANGDSFLFASDAEMAVRVGLSGEINVETRGCALLPPTLFKAILSQSADDELVLDLGAKGSLSVKGKRTQHTISTAKAGSYLMPKEPPSKNCATLPVRQLTRAMRYVQAMADYHGNWATMAVCVDASTDSLAFVSTDGNSIGAADSDLKCPANWRSLVPQRSAKLLASVFDGSDGEATIWTSDNWFAASSGSTLLLARQAEGSFPNWREFATPPKSSKSVSLPAGVFRAALTQAVVTNQEEQENSAVVSLNDGTMAISSRSSIGESLSEIPVAYEGKPFSIRLNWRRYLLDCLAPFNPADEITLKFTDSKSAFFITGGGLLFLVMPLPLKD